MAWCFSDVFSLIQYSFYCWSEFIKEGYNLIEITLPKAWIYHVFYNSVDGVSKRDPHQKTAFDRAADELLRLATLIAQPPKVSKGWHFMLTHSSYF